MKKFLLSRLLTWFSDQPDTVKSVVMEWVDEERGIQSAYADALRRLAEQVEADRDVEGDVIDSRGSR